MKGNNHVKKHKVTGFIGCVPVVTTEIPDPPSDEEEEVESPCEVHEEEREEDSNPMWSEDRSSSRMIHAIFQSKRFKST